MNYKCPFTASLCDVACRFWYEKPHKGTNQEDPDGPGSCYICTAVKVFCQEMPDIRRELTDLRKAVEDIQV